MCCVFTNLVVALVERLLAVPELLCQSAYFRPQLDVGLHQLLLRPLQLLQLRLTLISLVGDCRHEFAQLPHLHTHAHEHAKVPLNKH